MTFGRQRTLVLILIIAALVGLLGRAVAGGIEPEPVPSRPELPAAAGGGIYALIDDNCSASKN